MADVFVYGPLMAPALMVAVAGKALGPAAPAVLQGYAIHPLADDVVPGIAQMQGAQVHGVIWAGLDAPAFERLCFYAAVTGNVLAEASVRVGDQVRHVNMFLPDGVRQAGHGVWSLADWQADHLAPALLVVADLFALAPRPDPASLRPFWPAIEARAWSRHRARRTGPATIRHQAQSGDVATAAIGAPAGSFFRFQDSAIHHRRFDGKRSGLLRREAFIGFDAVIVLPYDPRRDKVVLLEQMRVGPVMRGDPNPWMLEAVAGIVDARETPVQAAMRETLEEAGVTPTQLIAAGAYYPSPGATTEYFHNFVGLCDLPATTPYLGGLDSEGEDLRLHPMPFDAAMALADTGEIATGPLLTLLYWLARHRDRLRAMG